MSVAPEDSVRIREATVEDVEGVVAVARDAWYATYGGFLEPATIEQALTEYYDPELVRAGVEHDDIAFYVAEVESGDGGGNGDRDRDGDDDVDETRDGLVGFASAERTWSDEVELHTIYVHPDRWGDGVGSALLDRVTSWARGQDVERIACGVLEGNAVGVGFFESKGFRRGTTANAEVAGELHPEYEFELEL